MGSIGSKDFRIMQAETSEHVRNNISNAPVTFSHVAKEDSSFKQVLLATAQIFVRAPNGKTVRARALIDQASESSFITSALAKDLKLPYETTVVPIIGIGGEVSKTANKCVLFDILSHYDANVSITIDAYVLPTITRQIPSRKLSTKLTWSHVKGLTLADPRFYEPSSIDVLIGADYYNEIILNGLHKTKRGEPIAQQTILGWILSGPISLNTIQYSLPSDHGTKQLITLHSQIGESISAQLQRFWEIEEVDQIISLSAEDKLCEEFFKTSYRRDESGRFVVQLPLKTTLPLDLSDTRKASLRSLYQVEKRFRFNPIYRERYMAFMQDYLQLGHMQPIPKAEVLKTENVCYLPHHGVLKEESSTTKLRVVFNGSQQNSKGASLNAFQYVGPKLQQDLCEILLNWRKHQFVLCADIQKMYRQIKVDKIHQDLQRILWRKSTDESIQEFRLTTVTYGLASAPYLAIRSLKQLAIDGIQQFPIASNILLNNFYVDDAFFGAESIESACKIQCELIKLLASGGFTLKKWSTNAPSLLDEIPNEDKESTSFRTIDEDNHLKTLGILWQPGTDEFRIKVDLNSALYPITKRKILSDISKIFDPLGWCSPTTINTKILIQKLWRCGTKWDEDIPSELAASWIAYRQNLHILEDIRIKPWIGTHASQISVELHGFSDASTVAYSAVVYARVTQSFDNIQTTLLMAKTKVAPIKTVSLPRLELCGASLLDRLINNVRKAMNLTSVPTHLWTDSTIVLAWLRGEPTHWKTFVANRVSEIQTSCFYAKWHHIPSQFNPADCASRGIDSTQLKDHSLWWRGPHFLRQDSSCWPSQDNCTIAKKNVEAEIRTVRTHVITFIPNWELLDHYSSLGKLLRVTAYIKRFIHNARNRTDKIAGQITSSELLQSLSFWVHHSQQQSFSYEKCILSKGKPLPNSSKLSSLSPFTDSNGILRVGGRLQLAVLPYDQKHPMILSAASKLSSLLISDAHQKTLHGGIQLTLGYLRLRFWIISARSKVRLYVNKCPICIRYRAKISSQLMGSLPSERITPSHAFEHTGVDYAGPINVRTTKGRGYKSYKSYIALFVCLVTKAVHIEVVSEMTTDAFIAAYDRFVSRRGLCTHLYSDNGTNFVGADRILKCMHHSCLKQQCGEIAEQLLTKGTEWHFIPPSAPHFGGLWKAGVKSIKHHLRRTIGNHTLTYEELSTLLSKIEACLNSRPLYPLSNDPDDSSALTPGHFLIGKPLLSIPRPSIINESPNLLARWKLVQRMYEGIWKIWSRDYLHCLQQRYKWRNPIENLKIADLVLVRDERCPPSVWLLGRILQLHTGPDGLARVATVKCKNSTIRRPIVKLVVLPVNGTTLS